jgi:predicted O-methyltransferase YrrM
MMKTLKRMIGPQWRFRAHRLGRLRWATKYRLMRGFNANVGLRSKLAYVLLDPEIESFSYELDNEPEVIAALAAALGRPVDELAAYAAETHRDPELNEVLARRLRWRFDVKRRMPLGNRLAWYVIARARKPALVVETGIYLGLGSLALLRALERNAEEGCPGELMSFDSVATAGSIVPERARPGWNRIVGSTRDLLPSAVENRRVDMLFQDTPHTEENQRFEFGAALSNAGESLLLLDASGGTSPTLVKMCEESGGSYHRIPLRSHQHIYPGVAITFAVFEEAGGKDARDG